MVPKSINKYQRDAIIYASPPPTITTIIYASPPPTIATITTITTIIYASPPAHCLIDVDEEEEGLQQRGGDHKPDSEHSSVNLIFRLSEEI